MPTNYRLGLVLREGRNFEDHDLLIDWYKQLPRNEHGEIHRDVLQRHLMAAMLAYVGGHPAAARLPVPTPRPQQPTNPVVLKPAAPESAAATTPQESLPVEVSAPQVDSSRLGFDDSSNTPVKRNRVSLGQVAQSLKT